MEEFEIEGEDMLARALCHELDHLDGVLYTEHVEGPLLNADEAYEVEESEAEDEEEQQAEE